MMFHCVGVSKLQLLLTLNWGEGKMIFLVVGMWRPILSPGRCCVLYCDDKEDNPIALWKGSKYDMRLFLCRRVGLAWIYSYGNGPAIVMQVRTVWLVFGLWKLLSHLSYDQRIALEVGYIQDRHWQTGHERRVFMLVLNRKWNHSGRIVIPLWQW